MLRITGGNLKGRQLASPSSFDIVRPTSSKVRQALFHILGDLNGLTFCDVCAGTGLVGIEALSRGAFHVTFVENNLTVYQQLKKNINTLSIQPKQFKLFKTNARSNLFDNLKQQFDIIFVDPPFQQNFDSLVQEMATLVSPNGQMVIQYPSHQSLKWKEQAEKVKVYGESSLAFIRF